MSKKNREKGKLDRSATVNIGGTIYNVHPQVQKSMQQMYQEGSRAIQQLKIAVQFGEKQVTLLEEASKYLEETKDPVSDTMVKWKHDVKDLMLEINPPPMPVTATEEEKEQAKQQEPQPEKPKEEDDGRHNDVLEQDVPAKA